MGGGSASPKLAAPMAGHTENMISGLGLSQGVTDAAIAMSPEMREARVDDLQKMASREATINALKSRELEELMDPALARMRKALPEQIEQDLTGGPSTELSNMWLKRGLADVVSTGAKLDSGFARSALADKTRQDYYANRMLMQDRAGRHLAENPQAIAGLDVGSIASAMSQADSENANARDAYKAQNLSMMSQNASNVLNAYQQAAQIEAQRRGQNTQAINAARAASAGNSSSLMGAGIGAAGAIAGSALVLF